MSTTLQSQVIQQLANTFKQIHHLMTVYVCSFDFRTFPLYIIAFAFVHHFFFINNGPNGPPMVRGTIPFLGVAFEFLRNPEQLLLKCQELHGDIFTLYIGGKRMHIICDSINAIPTIYRNFNLFGFSVLQQYFDMVLFGDSEKHAKDVKMHRASIDKLAPNLLAQDMVDDLVKTFDINLQSILSRETAKLNVDGQLDREGVVVDLHVWVRKLMFECSGKTLFGETWPTNDEFCEDYYQFEDGVYEILKGYPYILTRKAVQARERYYQRLVEMLRKPLVKPSRVVSGKLEVTVYFDLLLNLGWSRIWIFH
jgi:Cytochrome P450